MFNELKKCQLKIYFDETKSQGDSLIFCKLRVENEIAIFLLLSQNHPSIKFFFLNFKSIFFVLLVHDIVENNNNILNKC